MSEDVVYSPPVVIDGVLLPATKPRGWYWQLDAQARWAVEHLRPFEQRTPSRIFKLFFHFDRSPSRRVPVSPVVICFLGRAWREEARARGARVPRGRHERWRQRAVKQIQKLVAERKWGLADFGDFLDGDDELLAVARAAIAERAAREAARRPIVAPQVRAETLRAVGRCSPPLTRTAQAVYGVLFAHCHADFTVPLSLPQVAERLGSSVRTIDRALVVLRERGFVEHGSLTLIAHRLERVAGVLTPRPVNPPAVAQSVEPELLTNDDRERLLLDFLEL